MGYVDCQPYQLCVSSRTEWWEHCSPCLVSSSTLRHSAEWSTNEYEGALKKTGHYGRRTVIVGKNQKRSSVKFAVSHTGDTETCERRCSGQIRLHLNWTTIRPHHLGTTSTQGNTGLEGWCYGNAFIMLQHGSWSRWLEDGWVECLQRLGFSFYSVNVWLFTNLNN